MGISMIMKIIYIVLQAGYAHGLRPLVKEAIDDPDKEWDESLMSFVDRIFDYQRAKKGGK